MLDTIRKLLRGPKDAPPSAAALAAAIDALDAKATETRAALASAEDRRADAVLAGDADAAAIRKAVTDLAADLVDLGAARGRLAERLASARQAEAEADRQARYEAAAAKRDAAAKAVAARYPKLRTDLLSLIRQVAEADAEIAAANGSLPPGAASLAPVEAFRDRPALAEEVVETVVTEKWMARAEFGGCEITAATRGFEDHGDGEASFTYREAGTGFMRTGLADQIVTVTRTLLPWQAGITAARLATIRLPGMRAHDAAFEIDARFGVEPGDVLRALDRATAETPEPPAPKRQPVTRSDSTNMRPASLSSRAA